jgi:hypothetical protein
MPDTFVPESYGDKEWIKRRTTDIAVAETIADPLTMPDHAFKVTKGSCGMEIKADFGSATDSVTLTILRKIGENSAVDRIGTVALSACSNKMQVAAGELPDIFATLETKYVDIKGAYSIALVATTVSGTVNAVYTRFLN